VILVLLVVAVLGWAAVRAVSGSASKDAGSSVSSVVDTRESLSRLFRLGLLALTMSFVASGVSTLIAEAVESSQSSSPKVARSLSFLVVGAPALTVLAMWTKRRLADDPTERSSSGWRRYTTIVPSVALSFVVTSFMDVATSVVDRSELHPEWLGIGIASIAVWAVHWRLLRRGDQRPDASEPHVVLGSFVGLALIAVGFGTVVNAVMTKFYDARFADLLIRESDYEFTGPFVTLTIGILVWWWYWLRGPERGDRGRYWYAYVLLLGTFASSIAVVVGGSFLVHSVLQWFFGRPTENLASMHFASVPGALATVAAGAVVWTYHRSLLRIRSERETGSRNDVDRVYTYLSCVVGLVASAVGISLVFIAFLGAVTRRHSIVSSSDVADSLVLAATLLLIAAPLWAWHWRKAQVHARATVGRAPGRDAEIRSAPRRLYLVAFFGNASLVALVSLLIVLNRVFEDVGARRFGKGTLYDQRVALSIVLTTCAVAGYHWLVFREDRVEVTANSEVSVPVSPRLRRVVVMADGNDSVDALVRSIAFGMGVAVQVWRRTVSSADKVEQQSAIDETTLLEVLRGLKEPEALINIVGKTYEVVPFRSS
jgi:hypothetical protein